MHLSARLLLLFLLPLGALHAQFNQTEKFDVTDGMAMTEATTAYCDRKGYIWVLHNNYHMSRFDGTSFETYKPEETGHYFAGAFFAEDSEGLWVFCNRKSVSFFNGKSWMSWEKPEFRAACIDKVSDKFVVIDSTGQLLHFDHLKKLWIVHGNIPPAPFESEVLLNASLRETKYLLRFFKNEDPLALPLTPKKAATELSPIRVLKTFTTNSLTNAIWKEDSTLAYTDYDFSTPFTFSLPSQSFPGFKKSPANSHADILHNGLCTSQQKNIMFLSRQYPHQNIFEVEIFITNDDFEFVPYARILHAETKFSTTFDKSGCLWIASMSGLMRVYPDIILCAENNHNMVPSLHVINEDAKGNIWFGGYGSGLCYFDGKNIHPPPDDAKKFRSFLPGSYRDRDGNMGFWTEHHKLVTHINGKWTHKAVPNTVPGMSGYYFLPLSSGKLATGLGQTVMGIVSDPFKPSENWKFIDKSKGQLLENVLTIAEDSSGKLWMGRTGQGVSVYDPLLDTARTWVIQPNTAMNYGMASSTIDMHGRLWMGCSDGIRVLEHPGKFNITSDELPQKVFKIKMDEAGYSLVSLIKVFQHYIVFGNQHGYGFLDLRSFSANPGEPRIHFYSTEKFLQSCDQNAIYITDDNRIWIGQDKGAMCIDMNQHQFDTTVIQLLAPLISIRESSDKVITIQFDSSMQLRLPLKKRSFTIHLDTGSPGWLSNNVGFQYRIINHFTEDTTWSAYTKMPDIKIDYLPQGKSTFQIRALKNNQVADEISLSIMTPATLDENPYFWFSLFGGLSLIGFLITRHINRQEIKLKQKEIELSEQRREKEQFQIRAIANSLNPHFIKNSLNWAQTRFRSDHKVATVIDELSSNISTIFKRSREGQAFHSLADEFELVKNHLSIQQATYGEFLKITLPGQSIIEQYKDIHVPLMQIQIHVENAIEHGIRNRIGAHLLDIQLTDEADYLHLTITDDGIGRVAAQKLGSHGTQQGTFMLDSLYQIFNKYNTYKFSCEFEDLPLTDPVSGNPVGTRVHILIPKKYTYQNHENHSVLHS